MFRPWWHDPGGQRNHVIRSHSLASIPRAFVVEAYEKLLTVEYQFVENCGAGKEVQAISVAEVKSSGAWSRGPGPFHRGTCSQDFSREAGARFGDEQTRGELGIACHGTGFDPHACRAPVSAARACVPAQKALICRAASRNWRSRNAGRIIGMVTAMRTVMMATTISSSTSVIPWRKQRMFDDVSMTRYLTSRKWLVMLSA